jgi:hypothetical protein
MMYRLSALRGQFSGEPGQPPDAGLGTSCFTDIANRESNIADGLSGCHSMPPAELVGTDLRPHGVVLECRRLPEHCLHMQNISFTKGPNQGILKGNGSRVEVYSPLDRWKSESFKESPWHLIEAVDTGPLAPRAKL